VPRTERLLHGIYCQTGLPAQPQIQAFVIGCLGNNLIVRHRPQIESPNLRPANNHEQFRPISRQGQLGWRRSEIPDWGPLRVRRSANPHPAPFNPSRDGAVVRYIEHRRTVFRQRRQVASRIRCNVENREPATLIGESITPEKEPRCGSVDLCGTADVADRQLLTRLSGPQRELALPPNNKRAVIRNAVPVRRPRRACDHRCSPRVQVHQRHRWG
jgi:hypothetical protein